MIPAADLPDLASVKTDLAVPVAQMAGPAAGRRVFQTTAEWQNSAVRHTLYLPPEWTTAKKLPVLIEYAGNGGYRNKFGDVSTGEVQDCRLGHGLSGGTGFIWVCLPFVEIVEGKKQNAVKWWGDVAETKRYCLATVREVCARFGGDPERVILCGFSRGAIACNFIGLHDDEIAGLWRAFFCHSHYDGVNEKWPYADADRGSALARLRRLGSRPQWISHEGPTTATEQWLRSTGIKGHWTFTPIPFRNHSPDWLLRDIPERKQAREWLQKVVQTAGSPD